MFQNKKHFILFQHYKFKIFILKMFKERKKKKIIYFLIYIIYFYLYILLTIMDSQDILEKEIKNLQNKFLEINENKSNDNILKELNEILDKIINSISKNEKKLVDLETKLKNEHAALTNTAKIHGRIYGIKYTGPTKEKIEKTKINIANLEKLKKDIDKIIIEEGENRNSLFEGGKRKSQRNQKSKKIKKSHRKSRNTRRKSIYHRN